MCVKTCNKTQPVLRVLPKGQSSLEIAYISGYT